VQGEEVRREKVKNWGVRTSGEPAFTDDQAFYFYPAFLYGTTSTGTPLGGQETIDSNGMLLAIADDGPDIEFTGGSELTVGGFIDVNGNGDDFQMADDGDYMASSTVTVAGDTVVTLTYE